MFTRCYVNCRKECNGKRRAVTVVVEETHLKEITVDSFREIMKFLMKTVVYRLNLFQMKISRKDWQDIDDYLSQMISISKPSNRKVCLPILLN